MLHQRVLDTFSRKQFQYPIYNLQLAIGIIIFGEKLISSLLMSIYFVFFFFFNSKF